MEPKPTGETNANSFATNVKQNTALTALARSAISVSKGILSKVTVCLWVDFYRF